MEVVRVVYRVMLCGGCTELGSSGESSGGEYPTREELCGEAGAVEGSPAASP